jgi:hypothetical protein
MIIKSMSRKHQTFSQLFTYMKNGSSQNSEFDFFSKNLYSNNGKDITAEFLRNAYLLKARANGNYLFHEVISLTKSKQLTLLQEKERLFDIIRLYTEKRCNNNLVTGFLHDEKSNNIHYHLMISSNEIGEYKNQRLTKFDFDKVKKATEKYVIDKYPELEQDIIINGKKSQRKAKQSNKAGEVKRKGGRLDKKAKITETLKAIFSQSHSKDDFFSRLAEQNIELYNRGKTIGFINGSDNKKYRLKTLALESEFQRVSTLMAQENNKAEKAAEKGKQTVDSKKYQADQKSYSTQANDPQSEIDSRKDEFKKARSSSQAKQKNKNKEKSKDFER